MKHLLPLLRALLTVCCPKGLQYESDYWISDNVIWAYQSCGELIDFCLQYEAYPEDPLGLLGMYFGDSTVVGHFRLYKTIDAEGDFPQTSLVSSVWVLNENEVCVDPRPCKCVDPGQDSQTLEEKKMAGFIRAVLKARPAVLCSSMWSPDP